MSTPPRRLLPSIASLRALEALDRLGSASAVAAELNLTQSAVSRQLQTLERQLGQTLLIRDRKRLHLSPAAREFAGEARQSLDRIARAALKLQSDQTGGTLHLAILPTFGMRWLMPRLPGFARLYPDVTVNMSTRLEKFNFAEEPFDAAIHYGDGHWPGTDHLLLKREQVLPVCHPDLLQETPVKEARDLLTLPLLHIQTRPTAWSDWLTAQGEIPPPRLPGSMYDQFATIMQAVLHGLGVALMPDYLVETDLATGRLALAWGDKVEASGAYYLIWPETRAHDRALNHFRDWLATQAQPEDPLPR